MRAEAYKLAILLYMLPLSIATAGSGFYLGTHIARNELDTTTVTYSSTNPTSYGKAEDSSTDLGVRFGYKYKNRLTDRYFWAPELIVTTFDGSDYLYSTNLRFGYELPPYELYTTLGVSRVDKFTDNRLNYGLGIEYRASNNTSINFEWTAYDDITETTQSSMVIGFSRVDIQTDTVREINTFKLGFTYYFQGSR